MKTKYRTKNVTRTADLIYLRESEDPDTVLSSDIVQVAESLDFGAHDFSWKNLRKFAAQNYRKLRETNAQSAFGQLLRAGIQTIANNYYDRFGVNWPEYLTEVPSGKDREHYAPLHGSVLPQRTGKGVPYVESKVVGEDVEILNFKYMGGESFEKELFDDDQTGQINQRAQKLGTAQKELEEVYVAGRIRGTAAIINGVDVPASNFETENAAGTTITTPFSVNLYTTGSGNRPAAFSQMSVPALKVGYETLLNALDPLNIKIVTNPDVILFSPFDAINAPQFLNSSYYPGVPGLGGETASSASSGFASGAFGLNPIKGLFKPVLNRYLPQGAWYLGESDKGMIFQRRDPMEITQEQPQSGQSFDKDVIRYRSRSRWEAEWIDSRFWYQGNNGSISVTQ